MNVNPEDLIPKLPQPRDLQPFPTTEAIVSITQVILLVKQPFSEASSLATRNKNALKTVDQ